MSRKIKVMFDVEIPDVEYTDKQLAFYYGMVGNYARFGNPMDFQLIKEGKLYDLYSPKGKLTTRFITEHSEPDTIIEFGKYKDRKLRDVPIDYLIWCKENMKTSESKKLLCSEIVRRQLVDN